MAQKISKYSRLTLPERKLIEQHNKLGKSITYIAKALKRSKSTISNELRRGGRAALNYRHAWAHRNALGNRMRNRKKRKIHNALEAVILYHLFEYRSSPRQICGYLKRCYPMLSELHVCHETIYRYIYRSSFKKEIIKHLRRKGRRKTPNKQGFRGGIKNKVSIHKRPDYVIDREELGHWEGDLIIGKGQKSAMGTLVERSSRYVILVPVQNRSPKTITEEFSKVFKALPPHLRRSLTYDQGMEMADHEKLTKETGVKVYFADPGCPYQRGSNENTNGLLREYFPKKTDLTKYLPKEITDAQNAINSRPRVVLNFTPSKEIFFSAMEKPDGKLSQLIKAPSIFQG